MPRTGRNRTMPGTPSRAPARPTRASGMQPATDPTPIASRALGNPRAGTRKVPVTRTNRPMARSPHSTPKSTPESVRCSGGTGRIPQAVASRSMVRSMRSVTVATSGSVAPDSRPGHPVQGDGTGQSLQLDGTDFQELHAVGLRCPDHVATDQDLSRPGLPRDARSDVDRPPEVVAVAEDHRAG